MLIVEFAHHNIKNANISYTSFKLISSYYPQILNEKKIDFYSKFQLIDKLLKKIKKPIIMCCKNFYHAHQLQKQANNKSIKFKNHIFDYKI